MARRRYLGRLSGPLLDRIDLQVEMIAPSRAELLADRLVAESTAVVAARVAEARERAAGRFAGETWWTNAELPARELRGRFRPVPGALRSIDVAFSRGQLSARGVDRVLRVAWTLADLDGRPRPDRDHVDEALGLRPRMAAA